MPLQIVQGDYIYYVNTSLGYDDESQYILWNFSGGNPSTSTDQNPVVRYVSPNTSGYGVSLTIGPDSRPSYTTTSRQNNIIKVQPEYLSVDLLASSGIFNMGSVVNYTATGPTASIEYYTWNYPGVTGLTGLTGSLSVNIGEDWSTISGTQLGSTYSTYTLTSSVQATSLLNNTVSDSIDLTYIKAGPPDLKNFLTIGATSTYWTASDTGYTTNTLGMIGSGTVFVLSWAYDFSDLFNDTFRAHGEKLNYYTCNMDWADPSIYSKVQGQYVASGDAFTTLNVPFTGWETLDRITIGNYLASGDLTSYAIGPYFADTYNQLSNLYPPSSREWTPNDVSELVFNDLSFATQTSRSLELSSTGQPAAYYLGIDGSFGASGGKGGCCLPSIAVTGVDVILYFTFYYSTDGSISGINSSSEYSVVISDYSINSGFGNSLDGEWVLACDTPSGDGIATLINNMLAANSLSSYIEASASPTYAWKANSSLYYTETFQGLRLSIKDMGIGPYLCKVSVSSNYSQWPGALSTIPESGINGSVPNVNWLGWYKSDIMNPSQFTDSQSFPKRGWEFNV